MAENNHDKFSADLNPEQLLRLIFSYIEKITNARSLDKLLLLMADMGKEMVLSDRCTVWLIDEQRNELWTRVAHGISELRIPLDAGLVGLSISRGEPIFINDAYNNEEYKSSLIHGAFITDKQTGYHTKSLMVIPILDSEGKIIGAYQAINKMTPSQSFSEQDLEYLSLAASYSGKSLESAMLTQEIEETQKEIIFTMGEIGESRSKETGNHVKRVAEYSFLIAMGLGMDETEAELLKMASPMHDIGKVAIPDSVLNKPGKLTNEEYEMMQSHASIGYELLKNSNRKILKAASIVAQQHHEKWNGTGYPNELKGEDIHIYGRITAIADVFDALGSERVYKKAWDLERILNLFNEEKGQHFDPQVVDAFIKQLPHILTVKDQYSDDKLDTM